MFSFLTNRRTKLIREAQKQGFEYYATCANPGFLSASVSDGGLLVVSRFPIVTTEFRPFTSQPAVGGDIIALKGFLHVKIQVEQAHLHIVTTHT